MIKAKLIGNSHIVKTMSSMITNKKLSRSIVIFGEKGTGRKTAAKYIGSAILCQNSVNGEPCHNCHSCKMIEQGSHPDFIQVLPSGKNGIYRLESDLRPIISQAYIRPNESDYKVVVIPDMDNTSRNSQNVLLKIIEEPPEYLVVIMTAASKEYFLPTILSRVTALKTSEQDFEGCRTGVKLSSTNYTDETFSKAYSAFGGNIGKCIEFLDEKTLSKAVEITSQLCVALSRKDEYQILQALFKTNSDKGIIREVFLLLSNSLRDCAILRANVTGDNGETRLLSCCEQETLELSRNINSRRAIGMFNVIEEYTRRLNGNANVSLLLSSLGAQLMDILI
ncbi:MAG: hypothetical protein GX896_00110 [Clostridiales bacterium]|nr:hypothetical protein [Clostridiales bacterium]